ncbi:hypothetical protein FISHEDRAFT_78094 [Fistulina hepatica ATCC 64428]|nr:hypothetical protein FISHEDRAFT_78094 [Fistulina hepatica ATCC 64428]
MTTLAQRSRSPNDGSATMTLTPPDTVDDGNGNRGLGVLRLRGAHRSGQRDHITWAENVVDNEGCGRKKSKICCIYHKPRTFDQSSSDDSTSDSDSDDSDSGRARPSGRFQRYTHDNRHSARHCPGHDHGHDHGSSSSGSPSSSGANQRPAPSAVVCEQPAPMPNAYERVPDKGKKRADV